MRVRCAALFSNDSCLLRSNSWWLTHRLVMHFFLSRLEPTAPRRQRCLHHPHKQYTRLQQHKSRLTAVCCQYMATHTEAAPAPPQCSEESPAGPPPTGSTCIMPPKSMHREQVAAVVVYPRRRFLVLLMFSLLTCCNAIQWIMYSPVPNASKAAFSLSTSQLNMLSSIYMIVFVVGFFLSCSVIEKWSLRTSLLCGALLNMIGAAIKLGVGVVLPSYGVIVVAQVILAVAQIFLLAAPPILADSWFPSSERAGATAVGSMANNIGTAIGMFVAPLMVTQGDAATSRDFVGFFAFQFALALVPAAGIALWMPTVAPSKKGKLDGSGAGGSTLSSLSASSSRALPSEDSPLTPLTNGGSVPLGTIVAVKRVFLTVKALFMHRDYACLFCSFSISIGSIWAMSTLLAQILEPFGFSNTLAGLMGAMNLKGGALIAVLVGRWVDRYRYYKAPLLIANMVNSVCLSVMCLGLTLWFPQDPTVTEPSLHAKVAVFALYVLAGTAQNTVIPVCFEYAMEVTHPLPNSVPGALLMAGGNAVALILVSCGSSILGPATVSTQQLAMDTFAMVLGLASAGGIIALVAGERLGRFSMESATAAAAAAQVQGSENHAPVSMPCTAVATDAEPVS